MSDRNPSTITHVEHNYASGARINIVREPKVFYSEPGEFTIVARANGRKVSITMSKGRTRDLARTLTEMSNS